MNYIVLPGAAVNSRIDGISWIEDPSLFPWLLAGLRRSTFKLPPRELTIGHVITTIDSPVQSGVWETQGN